MLSLKGSKKIAVFVDKDCKTMKDPEYIYITEKENKNRLQTTEDNKQRIFRSFLELNKKIRKIDIDRLVYAYANNDILQDDKFGRLYDDASQHVNDSLEKYMSCNDSFIMPVIDFSISKRIYVTGASGSGKSTWLSHLLSLNRGKKQAIFFFSPFKDEGLYGLKNIIDVDMSEFEAENEREFAEEDIMPGSICVFDDIESHKTHKKALIELRNIILQRGRHENVSCITVSHNPMQGVSTKDSLRECSYYCMFKNNERDVTHLLKGYCNFNQKMVDDVLSQDTRYIFISKDVPKYYITNHSIKLL